VTSSAGWCIDRCAVDRLLAARALRRVFLCAPLGKIRRMNSRAVEPAPDRRDIQADARDCEQDQRARQQDQRDGEQDRREPR